MRHSTKSHSTKPSMMSRLTGGRRGGTVKTTVIQTTETPHHHQSHGLGATHHNNHNGVHTTHHQKRRPSFGDKMSGAMMKLKGSLLHRPGLKAAGTRRQHGTDGRGSHRATGY